MDTQEIIFRARYINKIGPLKKENKLNLRIQVLNSEFRKIIFYRPF